MNYSDVIKELEGKTYPKEIIMGDEKLIFYYNNKSRAEDGGVFVYRLKTVIPRPEKKSEVCGYISEGRTTAFSGVPHYTMDLHRTLFDFKNRLF